MARDSQLTQPGNGVVTYLKRVSLTLGIAAAVIYPTVTASIEWGQMRESLRANTDAVHEVAASLKSLAQAQTDSVIKLQSEIDTVNSDFARENAGLRRAIEDAGASVKKTESVVRDNTRAVDWHSYRVHQLEEAAKKGGH